MRAVVVGAWVALLTTLVISEALAHDNTRSKSSSLTYILGLQDFFSLSDGRSARSSSSSSSNSNGIGGNRPMGMSLSDSSSSPVEPIKPLLDLSSGGSGGSHAMPPHPVFDEAAPRNVSGLRGNAAYLHCLVHNLGNKSVSWIRQRDLHILTVGRYTYTTDDRYQVLHSADSQDWILKIKYAQVRDSGNYECQVSTKPIRNYVVRLNVFAPEARIVGAPDMHVDKGSTINLTCVIAHSPEPPAYIFWYHNDKVVSYDSSRGGITVVIERRNATSGYLLIQDARPSDTGNYTCAPSNTASTYIRVHVLNGETPAAMQTNGCPSLLTQPSSHILLSQALLTILLFLIPMLILDTSPAETSSVEEYDTWDSQIRPFSDHADNLH